MAICNICKKSYREPEDEQGDHECPNPVCIYKRRTFVFNDKLPEIVDKRKDKGAEDVR
jgi:hypothetical protein